MEVAKRAVWPLTAFGSWYVRTAKKHPFPVAFFTSGIKTSAADLLAQKVSITDHPASFALTSSCIACICHLQSSQLLPVDLSTDPMPPIPANAAQVVERREDIDWRRNATFTAFGFAYLGGVQYYLYNVKFVQWCGGITAHVGHIGVAPLKTFLDQAIQ